MLPISDFFEASEFRFFQKSIGSTGTPGLHTQLGWQKSQKIAKIEIFCSLFLLFL